MWKMLYTIACYAYAHGIRDIISKEINDPNSEWDERAVAILDRIFDFES